MARSPLLSAGSIVTHVLVVALAGVLVALGLWQLSRLGEVRAENARLAERLAQEPVELSSVADGGLDPDALEYRRAMATGRYATDDEVLQRSREHQGANGYHVLTPLALDGDRTALVRRGSVPFDLDEPPVEEAAPPDGEVTVTGILTRSETQPSFGASDPPAGHLDRVFRADVERLSSQVDGELMPMLLLLERQEPAQSGDLPAPVEREPLDEANHLSYAIQWFAFAAIAVVGYAAFLRKRHREHADDADRDVTPDPVGSRPGPARRDDTPTGAG